MSPFVAALSKTLQLLLTTLDGCHAMVVESVGEPSQAVQGDEPPEYPDRRAG